MARTEITTWEFVKLLFPKPGDTVGIMMYIEPGAEGERAALEARQMVRLAGEIASESTQRYLRAMNAKGYNIAMSMNPLKPGSTTRSLENVLEVRRLWIDLDTKQGQDGKTNLDKILNDKDCPAPSFVLNTSPGNYQAIWTVHGFTKEEAAEALRQLRILYGGDPGLGGDWSRVLRLPGLHNKKVKEPFQITAEAIAKFPYTKEHFAFLAKRITPELFHESTQLQRKPLDPPGREASSTRRWTRPREPKAEPSLRDTSRSGQDWGWCNEQLSKRLPKGQGFEDILSSLKAELQQRGLDRGLTNPKHYAEHTINKLRAEWEGKQHHFYKPREVMTPVNTKKKSPFLSNPLSSLSKEYKPNQEQLQKDRLFIMSSLRDKQTEEQIIENMLLYRMRKVDAPEPAKRSYIDALIAEAKRALEASVIKPTSREAIQKNVNAENHNVEDSHYVRKQRNT